MEENTDLKCGLFEDAECKRLFKARRIQKSKKPTFKRAGSHKFKRLDSNWRRPRGLQGKLRRHYVAKGAIAQVGYGSPKTVKGLHPSGFVEVLVHNPADVDDIDASIQAIRISGTVGGRKRALIESKADEMGIKIFNRKGGQ